MMGAAQFYQTKAVHPVELILVCTKDDILSQDRYFASIQDFKAMPGEVLLAGNQAGKLTRAYIAIGSHEHANVQAIAKAVKHLPAGIYQPKEALSTRAEVMWALAQYQFNDFKNTQLKPRVLLLPKVSLTDVLAEAEAIFKVRHLINMPTNAMGPKELAEAVEVIGKPHGATVEVITGDELLKANYPAIHAVGRAGEQAPRLARLTWGSPKHPKVSLVGKGVCFDSGGLDIKPARAMRIMKKDMGGAANAIGLAQWIMAIKLPIYLELLIPAVENAVSHNAYRPGDILTMRNGMTVEIDNTDAEGRLVLADAITKACESKPDLLIDFSTLTGAARVAVGTEITAMFSNHDTLANGVLNASIKVNDPVWRLPLFQKYNRLFESKVADLSNSSASSYAGAITAALFLEHFVTSDIAWMHYDFMAWNVSSQPGKPEGGEAMGIQALAAYLKSCYSSEGS